MLDESNINNSSVNKKGFSSALSMYSNSSSSSSSSSSSNSFLIPHRGSLRRLLCSSLDSIGSSSSGAVLFFIEVGNSIEGNEAAKEDTRSGKNKKKQQQGRLVFTKCQLDCMQRLFLGLDVESKGYLTYAQVQEFVHTRCPVVRRRDAAIVLQQHQHPYTATTTLMEAWATILQTGIPNLQSIVSTASSTQDLLHFYSNSTALCLEGWMILLRLISFCQYEEAKHFFSAKRLVYPNLYDAILLDIPRSPQVIPLTLDHLLLYEYTYDYRRTRAVNAESATQSSAAADAATSSITTESHHNNVQAQDSTTTTLHYCPPMPELDLNHSGISANDINAPSSIYDSPATTGNEISDFVTVESIGSFSEAFWQSGKVELLLTVTSTTYPIQQLPQQGVDALMSTVGASTTATYQVRRTLDDILWLHNTLLAHKKLGGTLCGRVLPPFQDSTSRILSESVSRDSSSSSLLWRTTGSRDTSYPASSSAASSNSTGLWSYCKSFGKSFVGTILPTSSVTQNCHTHGRSTTDSFSIQNLKLQRLERYLNYLLSHSGYRSSFPLNSLLKASKTGLEATKRLLLETMTTASYISNDTKLSASNRIGFSEEKAAVEYSSYKSCTGNNLNYPQCSSSGNNSSIMSRNFEWVRTAAQAAMALQVHGFLNATGMSSYSTRLQHASLPDLDYHQRYRGEYHPYSQQPSSSGSTNWGPANNTICVESTLDDDYDLLPTPTDQNRRFLYDDISNANSSAIAAINRASLNCSPDGLANGLFFLKEEEDSAAAANMDATIEKLRDTIGSVDECLNKSYKSFEKTAMAATSRADIHLQIVHLLDTIPGYRVVSNNGCCFLTMDEQSYLRGVTDIERCILSTSKSFIDTCEALSWQASLSSSAVSAAEDVRSAVRAARTAASAKAAAAKASAAAKKTLDKVVRYSDASGINKDAAEAAVHAAQTRVEISKSHEIHATLISLETSAVKRKAALALAYDVRQWSVHRKREMIKLCLSAAKSQRLVSRQWADSWRLLKEAVDGPLEGEYGGSVLLESLFSPEKSDDGEENSTMCSLSPACPSTPSKLPSFQRPYFSAEKEVSTIDTIGAAFRFPTPSGFQSVQKDNIFIAENNVISDFTPECFPEESEYMMPTKIHEPVYAEFIKTDVPILPMNNMKDSSNNADESSMNTNPSLPDHSFSKTFVSQEYTNMFCDLLDSPVTEHIDNDTDAPSSPTVADEKISTIKSPLLQLFDDEVSDEAQVSSSQRIDDEEKLVTSKASDAMTASMQSLVEGLLTWGALFDQPDSCSSSLGPAACHPGEKETCYQNR